MIKAALYTPNLTMGGAEQWVVSLARSIVDARVKWVSAVVSGWGGLDEPLCRELARHVPVHMNRDGWREGSTVPNLAKRYFSHIHGSFSDAIVSACQDADVLVAWGGDDLGKWLTHVDIPKVLTSHTSQRVLERPIVGFSHLVAVSEAATVFFSDRNHQRLPIDVLYNGADPERCQPRILRIKQRQYWGFNDDDIVIGYLGRHSPEKNPAAAIKAISELPSRFKAVYYGGPTPRDQETTRQLRRLADEMAPGRVRFFAPIERIGDVLGALDVFMLASHREAFSLGLIEAWLAGVPVVATPVGSLPELERMYSTKLTMGVSCEPSSEELASAVLRCLTPDGANTARIAQRIAEQRFTCAAMADRWATYLERIVAEKSEAGKVNARYVRSA